jgi:hypothetical protein
MITNYYNALQHRALPNIRNIAILTADKKSAKTVKKAVGLPAASKKDTVTLSSQSSQALLRKNQLSLFGDVTSVGGKAVKELKAVNNVLTLNAGEYFSVRLDNGMRGVVSSGSERTINVPWEVLNKEVGIDDYWFDAEAGAAYYGCFNPETGMAYDRMDRFLTALCDFSTYCLSSQFTQEELLDYFGRIGIEPGGWVEINNRGRVNRFYLLEDGIVWPGEQSENARWCLANEDWRKSGCTSESVMIVNGKEYKMD